MLPKWLQEYREVWRLIGRAAPPWLVPAAGLIAGSVVFVAKVWLAGFAGGDLAMVLAGLLVGASWPRPPDLQD